MTNSKGFWKDLGAYLLEKPRNAILLTLVVSFLPIFNQLAPAIMCFVTLRRGYQAGAIVLLWAALPYSLLFGLGFQAYEIGFDITNSLFLPFILSLILRQRSQWNIVLSVLLAFGIGLLFSFHAFNENYAVDTINAMQTVLKKLPQENAAINQQQQAFIEGLSDYTPYVLAIKSVFIAILALANVMVARALQGHLFNPQGFKKEILSIRLNVSWLLLYLGVFSWWFFNFNNPLAIAVFYITTLSFVISGWSIIQNFYSKNWAIPRPMVILSYVCFILFMNISLIPVILCCVYDILKNTSLGKSALSS